MPQIVKNLPAMQETTVQSLDWKDPLGREMATHSIILAWEIPWTEELGGLQSMVSQKSRAQLTDNTAPKVMGCAQRTSKYKGNCENRKKAGINFKRELWCSWEIDGETVETVSDFILGGSKITADGDCSHEIKRRLLLGRKVMTNLDSILKSRDVTLPTKVRLVKAMVFPVVMYGCESWTVKKAEHQRIDAFDLWCWRSLLRVPWTARRSNQSILKISPGCSMQGMMLKLKLQYFGHLIRRADSFEKTLMLEKTEGRRRR